MTALMIVAGVLAYLVAGAFFYRADVRRCDDASMGLDMALWPVGLVFIALGRIVDWLHEWAKKPAKAKPKPLEDKIAELERELEIGKDETP